MSSSNTIISKEITPISNSFLEMVSRVCQPMLLLIKSWLLRQLRLYRPCWLNNWSREAWWNVIPVLLLRNPPKYGFGLCCFSTATVTIFTCLSQPSMHLPSCQPVWSRPQKLWASRTHRSQSSRSSSVVAVTSRTHSSTSDPSLVATSATVGIATRRLAAFKAYLELLLGVLLLLLVLLHLVMVHVLHMLALIWA